MAGQSMELHCETGRFNFKPPGGDEYGFIGSLVAYWKELDNGRLILCGEGSIIGHSDPLTEAMFAKKFSTLQVAPGRTMTVLLTKLDTQGDRGEAYYKVSGPVPVHLPMPKRKQGLGFLPFNN